MTIQGLLESALSSTPNGTNPVDIFSNIEIYVGDKKVEFLQIEMPEPDTTGVPKIILKDQ